MVSATMYLGVLGGAVLQVAVLSTYSMWDTGAVAVLGVTWAAISWAKDNQQDSMQGSTSSVAMSALSLSVILLVVSEAALFLSAL